MGEEVKMTDYEGNGGENDHDGGDDARVTEWEMGLPSADDLTPLSHHLISPELALAFSISPEPCRTQVDVNRASEVTLSNLCGSSGGGGSGSGGSGGQLNTLSSNNNFKPLNDDHDRGTTARDPMLVEPEDNGGADRDGSGSESRKMRKLDSEEADSVLRPENSTDDPSARSLKRPRLVWTPQLHKRFVDVVAYLGIKNAVPKTIMQLMNVEGLTRENVASHLQKYRLYLKRMQGLSNEGPSPSDHLFASTPVPQSLHESGGGGGSGSGGGSNCPPPPPPAAAPTAVSSANGHLPVPMPGPYHQAGAGAMMPGPMYGHLGMPQIGNNHHYHHYHHHHGFDRNAPPYNMLQQQKEWSGNNYGSVVSYPHHHPHQVAPNDNM
ncbi:unnamed protein product [Linum tenue]|uniref:HTH myb-type domain-containing protein n=1 Tax=Linum tenue TaxID=586396 RepID=A0AAV0Q6B2_9ROSI|nr:unnamed protein product [Linum tenue]